MISFLIGIPFLLSALSKSIDSGFFLRLLAKLRLPTPITSLLAVLIISVLWFVWGGFALSQCTSITIPMAKIFLYLAIPITLVQWFVLKRPSCGCYGPGLRVPPAISIGIDVLLLIAISKLPFHSCTRESLQFLLVPVIIGIVLSRMSQKSPLLDLSPTAINKKWTHPSLGNDRTLVAFISPTCSTCSQWYPILLAVHRHLPVLVLSSAELEDSLAELPQEIVSRQRLLSWVESFPTILILEQEKIQVRWRGAPKPNMLSEIMS